MKKIKLKDLQESLSQFIETDGEDAYFYVYTNMGVVDWWWCISEENFLEKSGNIYLPAFDEEGKDIKALMLEDRASRLKRAKEVIQSFSELLDNEKAVASIKEMIDRTQQLQADIEMEKYDDQELLDEEFKQILEIHARKTMIAEWKNGLDKSEKAIRQEARKRRAKLMEVKNEG